MNRRRVPHNPIGSYEPKKILSNPKEGSMDLPVIFYYPNSIGTQITSSCPIKPSVQPAETPLRTGVSLIISIRAMHVDKRFFIHSITKNPLPTKKNTPLHQTSAPNLNHPFGSTQSTLTIYQLIIQCGTIRTTKVSITTKKTF
jgi:hypothetical protein